MLSVQFQNSVVAVGIVDAGHWCYSAVIVRGSFLQLLGHSHFSEHRTITASNAMLDSRCLSTSGFGSLRLSYWPPNRPGLLARCDTFVRWLSASFGPLLEGTRRA